LGGIALLKNAPHPSAAKAFIDFALSLDGQKLLQDKGAAADASDWGRATAPQRSKTFTMHVGSDEHEQLGKEFNKVFKVQ
jgi:ABC-type glycerol-3-phosphate transport system substrate-binding protein